MYYAIVLYIRNESVYLFQNMKSKIKKTVLFYFVVGIPLFSPISFNNIVYFNRSLFPPDFKDQKAAAV